MATKPLTVLFMPESAHGPTNNCIGIGDVLHRRGHRVVFAPARPRKASTTRTAATAAVSAATTVSAKGGLREPTGDAGATR